MVIDSSEPQVYEHRRYDEVVETEDEAYVRQIEAAAVKKGLDLECPEKMKRLDLRGINLRFVPPTWLANAVNVKELYLSDNHLTELPAEIGNMVNLEDLYVDHNQLTALPVEIGNLNSLRSLNASSNHMTILPHTVGHLHSLRKLYLHRNRLTELPIKIGNLTNLTMLHVQYNKLTAIPDTIQMLTSLRSLFAFNNFITELPKSLGLLYNLREASFGYNLLSSLPESFNGLICLQRLHLYYNRFSAFPMCLSELSNLTELDMDCNMLTTLPPFDKLPRHLSYFSVKNNRIASLPVTSYREPKTFIITGNPIDNEERVFNTPLVDVPEVPKVPYPATDPILPQSCCSCKPQLITYLNYQLLPINKCKGGWHSHRTTPYDEFEKEAKGLEAHRNYVHKEEFEKLTQTYKTPSDADVKALKEMEEWIKVNAPNHFYSPAQEPFKHDESAFKEFLAKIGKSHVCPPHCLCLEPCEGQKLYAEWVSSGNQTPCERFAQKLAAEGKLQRLSTDANPDEDMCRNVFSQTQSHTLPNWSAMAQSLPSTIEQQLATQKLRDITGDIQVNTSTKETPAKPVDLTDAPQASSSQTAEVVAEAPPKKSGWLF
jgi:Leucine-rich repeat (LRR) protein